MTDFKFDPRKTALLNIDMQNCFVKNSPLAAPRGREILPRINKQRTFAASAARWSFTRCIWCGRTAAIPASWFR